MLVLEFGPNDLARCRFATSPLWETMAALRLLTDPRPRTHHLPWLDAVSALLPSLDLLPLVAIQPRRGFTPDFLTPTPVGPVTTVEQELATVRSTGLGQVAFEVAQAFTDRDGEALPPGASNLLDDVAGSLARIADGLEAAWHALVEPYWPRLQELFDADLAHHGRILLDRGLEAVLPALHDSLRWNGHAVEVGTGPVTQSRSLDGLGLTFQPSAFTWPTAAVKLDEPWAPAIVYPARGIAELWQPVASPASGAMARLLGATRATLLASLREPASTTTLARRHGLAPGTVSGHLGVLRDAGLITSRRERRQVMYRASELGVRLSDGDPGAGSGRPR